jgi:glycine cleavage system H protein
MTPEDRRYAQTHEWVKIEGEDAVVGLTAHAQEALGDVTYVEPPLVGRAVRAGESCCVIESVKAASDMFAPVSGKISAINAELGKAPELLNSDPYGRGWIFRMTGVSKAEIEKLMDAAAYEAHIRE